MAASSKFERLVCEAEMLDHLDALSSLARPCFDILMSAHSANPGCSKFGGTPDLPTDFVWPRHALGPYRFIAQFNLSELPELVGGRALPSSGLLSFFQAHDADDRTFWRDPHYVRVFHVPEGTLLSPHEPPAEVRLGASFAVQFEPSVDIPGWPDSEDDRAAWPLDADWEDHYGELRQRLRASRHHLLGFPYNSTLAYDPTPGPQWCSLLTLASDSSLAWNWHDDDWLVTFVDEGRLQLADFSMVVSDAG